MGCKSRQPSPDDGYQSSRQCHQAWLGVGTVDDSARSIPQNRSCVALRRCQTTETMVHGPEPDWLLAILTLSVCYIEYTPIKILHRTQLALHGSKRHSAPVVNDSEDTQSTYDTLRWSYTVTIWVLLWCVRVFQLFKVGARFEGATLRFLVLISSI